MRTEDRKVGAWLAMAMLPVIALWLLLLNIFSCRHEPLDRAQCAERKKCGLKTAI